MKKLDPKYEFAHNDPFTYELIRYTDSIVEDSEQSIAPILMDEYIEEKIDANFSDIKFFK